MFILLDIIHETERERERERERENVKSVPSSTLPLLANW